MEDSRLMRSMLLDFYGELLTDKQRECFDLHYNEDLSLAEIAENTGISRQGVRESIKKSEAELRLMEEKLHLAEKTAALRSRCAEEAQNIENALALLPDGREKQILRETISYLRALPI